MVYASFLVVWSISLASVVSVLQANPFAVMHVRLLLNVTAQVSGACLKVRSLLTVHCGVELPGPGMQQLSVMFTFVLHWNGGWPQSLTSVPTLLENIGSGLAATLHTAAEHLSTSEYS